MYFLGIGGIGMSALARYFSSRGLRVAGYDRTPSDLTRSLENEGISISYEDTVDSLPEWLTNKTECLVVRTPAVPENNVLFQWFVSHGYDIRKRAEVLGLVTRDRKALCVAGTHGKTTTSTILAHLLRQSHLSANAFLGGISNNYHTNLLLDEKSDFVVVEADEFDRSFHHLSPYMSIITAVDPDHLDIYGTPEAYRESFEHYTSLVQSTLIIKQGVSLAPRLMDGARCYRYGVIDNQSSTDYPDFYADNILVKDGSIYFDFHTPKGVLTKVKLGVPVWVNIENSVAAMAMAWLNGVTDDELRSGLASFSGVYRRFNVHVNTAKVTMVDDYAHHPTELNASIQSIRRLFPHRRLVAVFQPHLFTRTRDFADAFARVLAQADEVILLPIYPARELPIEGVNSEMLMDKIRCAGNENVSVVEKADLVAALRERVEKEGEYAIITLGAGDIDRLVQPVADCLKSFNC